MGSLGVAGRRIHGYCVRAGRATASIANIRRAIETQHVWENLKLFLFNIRFIPIFIIARGETCRQFCDRRGHLQMANVQCEIQLELKRRVLQVESFSGIVVSFLLVLTAAGCNGSASGQPAITSTVDQLIDAAQTSNNVPSICVAIGIT